MTSENNTITLEMIWNEMARLKGEIQQNIKDNNIEMMEKISGISGQMDLIVTKLSAEISNVRTDLTFKIDHLDNETTKRFEVLASSVADTNNELMRLKRLNELLILGIPFTKNEDLKSIFMLLCAKVNFDATNCNFSIFRLGKSSVHDKPAAVLLRFIDQTSATGFMKAYFEYRVGLNVTDIGFSSSRRIYIRQNLTPLHNQIYTKCLELKAASKIHSVLLFDGIVYVRKLANSIKYKVKGFL